MEPINYMALLPKVDLGREFSELGNLLALRREDLQKQKETEDSDLLQQQYLADLENARKDGSQEAWAGMIGKYPKQREALKDVAKIYGDERLNNEFKNGMEISNAFQNNAPDIAKAKLESILESYKNSGQDPGVYKTVYDNLQSGNVKDAQSMTNFALSSLFPEKFSAIAKARSEMGKLPSDIRQAEANATKAEYEAQDTPEKLALANEKTISDLKNADTKRKLDALDIQIKQSNSETDKQRLQLERDKLLFDLQSKTQNQQEAAQNQLDTVNNSLNTVNSLLNHPLWESSKGLIGTGVGSTVGKWLSVVPGTQNKDFDMLLDTVKSQQFLTQVQAMKGLGSLSNAEGERIERAIASLSRDQSPEALKTALNVIKTTLERGQAKIVSSGKLSQNGGAFVMQHPVFGNIDDGKINALLQKNPGATRQQIIDYLNQTGGK